MQPSLFDLPPKKERPAKGPQPLVCSFKTPWLDHFAPPIGTGKGCAACETFGAATR